MTYLGEDPNIYKRLNYTLYKRVLRYSYQQDGDGDYSDLVKLIKIFDKHTNETYFEDNLPKIFDIEYYLRQLVVEILIVKIYI